MLCGIAMKSSIASATPFCLMRWRCKVMIRKKRHNNATSERLPAARRQIGFQRQCSHPSQHCKRNQNPVLHLLLSITIRGLEIGVANNSLPTSGRQARSIHSRSTMNSYTAMTTSRACTFIKWKIL